MRIGICMKSIVLLHVGLLALVLTSGSLYAEQPPWEVNPPIVSVDRQVIREYYTDPETGNISAVGASQFYVGPELERKEIAAYQAASDTPFNPTCRYSWDNGRTWTPYVPMDPPEYISYLPTGERVYWAPGWAYNYDSSSQKTVAVWMHQVMTDEDHNGKYDHGYNHSYIRTSTDFSQTWSTPQLVTYEAGGATYNPEEPISGSNDPLDPDFLHKNQSYAGQELTYRSDGALVFSGAYADVPDSVPMSQINPDGITAPYLPADARNIGGIDFVGTWNSGSGQYDWSASNVVWTPRHVSSRGLMEPSVAELTDGRVLTIYRDSNTGISGYPYYEGGHKRYTISTDGGATISDPAELKYDDGTSFYSPSSIHNLVRHSVSGKLYWFGNINMNTTNGDHYRYPLVIAEVDEVNVALKKDTVTLIDTRAMGEGVYVQMSNFMILEDRETHDFEMYLTRLGEDPTNTWKANCYKYTLTLVPPKPEDTDPTPVISGGTIPYAWYRTDVENVDTAVVTYLDESGRVAWLQDQTGSRHIAAVGDPQLTDNGIDGRSCLTCTGQDDYMLGTEAEWGEAAPGTVFAVWRRTGTTALGTTTLYDSTDRQRQVLLFDDSDTEDVLKVAGAVYDDGWEVHSVTLDDPVGTDQWAISTVSHVTGSTDVVRINGEELYSGNLLSGGMTGLRLGGFMLNYQRHWTGDIAEFIVFEGELTPEEVETIELILMVRWSMVTLVPGDTNNDGMVDQQDAEKLVGNWGTNVTGGAPEGDFDGDGLVGPTDAVILAAHWGYGTSEANSVPEPSTWVLLAAASLLWIVQRRR